MGVAGSIRALVSRHLEEAGLLWLERAAAVRAPNYSPAQFAQLDTRLEANLDALRVAGDEGWVLAQALLGDEGADGFFVASVLALEAGDDRFARVVASVSGLPAVARGVGSAMGWVEPRCLSGHVKSLLAASSPVEQMLGLAACALHRKDPGAALQRALLSTDAAVRARALRAAGELGRLDLLPHVTSAIADDHPDAAFWASWSATLLGNRGKALDALAACALRSGPRQRQALQLALQAMDPERGHELLRQLAGASRLRVVGAGIVGHVRYVPWLIDAMRLPPLARVAAEAFVNITGADFNLEQLETTRPEGFEDGPTEDPADESVDVPEDTALPWPDQARVNSWWERNRSQFAVSTRSFLGRPVTAESCVGALRAGFQRQRIVAAQQLCVRTPGTPLFNTSAPAWRQRQLLAGMG